MNSDQLATVVGEFPMRGWANVAGVFTPDEVERMRSSILQAKERLATEGLIEAKPQSAGFVLLGDILTIDELKWIDYVQFDRRMIEIAAAMLKTNNLVYTGDSSIHLGANRGFHRDNIIRWRMDSSGDDWKTPYTIIRLGVYLEDHKHHSGGLRIRERSHLAQTMRGNRDVILPTEPGDVAVWYLTTSHSPAAIRIRGIPVSKITYYLEPMVPSFLRVPEQRPRIACFCTFAAPSNHLDNYLEYQRGRADCQEFWKQSAVGTEFERLATQRGVTLVRPVPEYGSLYKCHESRLESSDQSP